jgi:hypothetical protein
MRSSNPLIVILPAVPTPIGDLKSDRTPDRSPSRTIRLMLVLIALGAVMGLGLRWAMQ